MNYCNRTRRAPFPTGSSRRGLTLVELIVVVVILTMITAATIPLMAPGTQGRRQREAARLLATEFSAAQTDAIASGRSAGVMLERIDGEYRASTTLTPCRVPAPYAGDSTNARIEKTEYLSTDANGNRLYRASFRESALLQNPPSDPAAPDSRLVRPNDVLLINGRDTTYYQITHVELGVVNFQQKPNQPPPPIIDATIVPPPPERPHPGLQFKIIRQPERTSESPVTLPEGAVVDIRWSGFSGEEPFRLTSTPSAAQQKLPVVVMFSPTGRLESVRTLKLDGALIKNDPIAADKAVHFLVGSRERVESDVVDRDAPDEEQPNWRVLENFWVTIQPTTGLVSHAPVAVAPDYANVTTFNAAVETAMNEARAFAGSHRSMGGN